MDPRITSNFSETTDGKWSYTVSADGEVVARGDGYASLEAMQTHRDRDIAAARRNLETSDNAQRFAAERQPAIVVLAADRDTAAAACSLVHHALKVPAHIEPLPLGVFGDLPEGVRPVGLCVVGVELSQLDVWRWALDTIVSRLPRGAVYAGIESDVSDLVPAGGRLVRPFA